MKREILKTVLIVLLGTATLTSCKSTTETENNTSKRQQQDRQRGGERLSTDQIFAQMDTNKDGKLSKTEVKGPLAKGFSDIDKNEDGYISKEELENAPKPERRQRPRN
ncbi:EF-hand domain-containing protein [Tenacibaculum aquimarinum]|uniref:EF-hand domain-containing protein n=1 Tax=Tenacibaculum aquimarinum TaxID=2910675 RepID=UPI001F0B688D|nr:EF-hand domain-containing protein [Tenacibaculum aquimarinum]MCH3884880.1 EF-hand domain-containing protein [Tenacibaculum aquimarinum]